MNMLIAPPPAGTPVFFHFLPRLAQKLALFVAAVAGCASALAADPAVPPLDQCLRRINLIANGSDASHVAALAATKEDGIIDCDCDCWVITTQVHGYTVHPTKVGVMNPGLVKENPVKDLVDLVRERHPHTRIVGYMHPRTSHVLDKHPEWKAIDAFKGGGIEAAGPVACLSTGFLEQELKPYLKELIQDYDFDGFWFDGGILNDNECGCPVCRQAFAAETGLVFPNLDDKKTLAANYLAWLKWRHGQHERHYKEITDYVQSLKPSCSVQILVGSERAWLEGDVVPRNSEALFRATTESSLELFWHVDGPGDAVYTNLACQMARGISGRLSEAWTPPATHGFDGVGVPGEELRARVWTMLANGVVPQIPIGGWGDVADLQAVYREIKAVQPYLVSTRPLKYAAMVAGENTALAMPKAEVRAGVVPEVMGIYRMLLEEHVPVDVLGGINLEQDDLSVYRVLILPEYFVLSEKAEKRVREYVRAGGGLVCTGRTGLFEEDGSTRTNFALSDVVGANFVSFTEERERGWMKSRMAITIPGDYFPGDKALQVNAVHARLGMGTGYGAGAATYWGNHVTVKAAGATEVLTLRKGTANDAEPFLLRNAFGRGQVSFLPARIGQSYDKYSYPYLRRIFTQEMERVAGAQPTVRFEAPKCVQATCWTQPLSGGGTRLVIQLLNELTGQGRADLARKAWPTREEEVKIAGIRLRLEGEFAGRTPVLQPEGVALTKDSDGAYRVPELGLHQVITVDPR